MNGHGPATQQPVLDDVLQHEALLYDAETQDKPNMHSMHSTHSIIFSILCSSHSMYSMHSTGALPVSSPAAGSPSSAYTAVLESVAILAGVPVARRAGCLLLCCTYSHTPAVRVHVMARNLALCRYMYPTWQLSRKTHRSGWLA